MYNENSNNKNAWVTELIIKVFIVIAFMLSSNILMYHFLPWVFWRDVVTIVSFFLGVYWIFGHETTQYRYGLISDELTIYVGKGKRERLILNISVADIEKIARVTSLDHQEDGKKKYMTRDRYYNISHQAPVYYCIYLDAQKGAHYCEFKPTRELVCMIMEKIGSMY